MRLFAAPLPKLLYWSAFQRLALAAVLVGLLWLAVYWALH